MVAIFSKQRKYKQLTLNFIISYREFCNKTTALWNLYKCWIWNLYFLYSRITAIHNTVLNWACNSSWKICFSGLRESILQKTKNFFKIKPLIVGKLLPKTWSKIIHSLTNNILSLYNSTKKQHKKNCLIGLGVKMLFVYSTLAKKDSICQLCNYTCYCFLRIYINDVS